jgi:cell wall-associated NlpC family hydrolase
MESKFKISHRNWLQRIIIFALLLCVVGQTACTQKVNNSAAKSTKGKSKVESVKANELPLISQNGTKYVNAKNLVELLGLHGEWNGSSSSYSIGDKDVNYILKLNSREAQKEGDTIKLAAPPVLINQSLAIPLTTVSDLFQHEMSYSVNDNHLIVQENPKDSTIKIKSINDNYLDFGDDPDDPNKNVDLASSAHSSDISVFKSIKNKDEAVAVLANINIPQLIKKSKQYMGVRYIFGAAPYPKSGGFDCSSFTQYVFGKYGIKLNRLARDQAKQGISVSRKNLRVGDLLFFNVPGRFKSSNMVGHVGIYLGNQKMIDADTRPKNGVQITDINKPYWKKVFLSAKRVAS